MKCYAAGCNYGTRTYNGPKRSKFRFPEDPERRKQWILACRRADSVPGRFSSLCDAHFEPGLIVSNIPEPKLLPDGTAQTTPQRGHYCPRLLPHAVPTIFFDDPSGPRIGGTQIKRRLPDDEEFPIEDILAKSLSDLPPKGSEKRTRASRSKPISNIHPSGGRSLSCLGDVLKCLEEMATYPKSLQLGENWLHVYRQAVLDESESSLLLYQLDTINDPPVMTKSVKLSYARFFEAYDRSHKITDFVAQSLGLKKSRFRHWSQIVSVLSLLENYSVELFQFDFTPPPHSIKTEAYSEALQLLHNRKLQLDVTAAENNNHEEVSKVSFLMEQIALLDTHTGQPSFSDALRSWSEHLAKKDPDVLSFLRKSGALTLPEFTKYPELDASDEATFSETD